MARMLQQYEHDGLTVSFDTRRCIHAAECVRRLPLVFRPAERPWVRPELADAAEIIATVHRCPSGALRVARDGVPIEINDDTLTVNVSRNGPLMVRGPLRLVDSDGAVLLDDVRASLCRCGASRRKPLCDGSHRDCGFRDP
jgi:uncharacterized Fe-S cluster protein YjdI